MCWSFAQPSSACATCWALTWAGRLLHSWTLSPKATCGYVLHLACLHSHVTWHAIAALSACQDTQQLILLALVLEIRTSLVLRPMFARKEEVVHFSCMNQNLRSEVCGCAVNPITPGLSSHDIHPGMFICAQPTPEQGCANLYEQSVAPVHRTFYQLRSGHVFTTSLPELS